MKIFLAALVAAAMSVSQAQARPVLVELFTSQACSSCPPADALLGALQKSDAGILPLSFNVTYWNGPAWTDRDSLDSATARQNWYAGLAQSDSVYTPEAVVDGTAQMVGSDRDAVTAAIAAARHADTPEVPVGLSGGSEVTVSIGSGKAVAPSRIWVFGFDTMHTTRIGGGENGGATITEVNVVRSITSPGNWYGKAWHYTLPRPAGAHLAVVLQGADGTVSGIGLE